MKNLARWLARRDVSLCGLALIAFAVFAPVIRFVIFHDDIPVWLLLIDRTALNIFESRATDNLYRPISYALWIVVRDAFGLVAPLLHFINLACHVLNTVLVSVLALRLSRYWQVRSWLLAWLNGLIFAVFPFSYQSVHWASAEVHPLMVLFGLMGTHAYLRARTMPPTHTAWRWLLIVIAMLCVLAACLTHEMGFLFGLVIAWIEVVLSLLSVLRRQRQVFWPAVLPLLTCVLFLFAFRVLGRSTWSSATTTGIKQVFADFVPNMLFFAQGFVAWLVILLRPRIGLILGIEWVVLTVFSMGLIAGLVVQWRARLAWLGVLGLGLWLIGSAAPSAVLSAEYVAGGPRLLYLSSLGVALFWATFSVACLRLIRPAWLRVPVWVLMGGLFAWCLSFIVSYTQLTLRYSSAMRYIGQDARQAGPNVHVLIINPPEWIASSAVPFWLGHEGIPLWPDYVLPNAYLISGGDIVVSTALVHHEISLTRNDEWLMSIAGAPVEDALLRQQVRQSNLIYRFDYDGEGIRARKLGMLQPVQRLPPSPPLAKFIHSGGQVLIESAVAARCGNDVELTITWMNAPTPAQLVSVFVHGFDPKNAQVLAADQDPLSGYWPLNEVPADVRLTESRLLRNVPTLSEIHLGIYFRDTLKRLQTLRADGSPWQGDAIAIPVTHENCPSAYPR